MIDYCSRYLLACHFTPSYTAGNAATALDEAPRPSACLDPWRWRNGVCGCCEQPPERLALLPAAQELRQENGKDRCLRAVR
ncbi:MAG: hypothetical protein ACREB3_17225, partial [Burkholderiales bacterium]